MIDVEMWAEIRRLHTSEGMAIKQIARQLGVARNTVRAALASDRPPRYERAGRGSIVDAVVPQICEQLRIDCRMPASVIGRRIGWTRSGSVLRAKVAELRPLFVGVDPVDRTEYRPGEVVQCDLVFPARVPVAPGVVGMPPVLSMVSCWCGFMMGRMIPSRSTEDLLAGMWQVVSDQLGAVPKVLVWDHEAGIGVRRLTDQARAFAGTLGCRIVQVRARRPEHKGMVERANRFIETSFVPGRVFSGPDDFNAQLADWWPVANQRRLARIAARPADWIEEDRAHMAALPPVAPRVGFLDRRRLGRDYYVRVAGNDYSVDPGVIGRMVDIDCGLDRVRVTCQGQVVADHPRSWTVRGQVTDPAHRARAKQLREEYDQLALKRAAERRQARPVRLVAERPLAEYDQLFGLPQPDASKPNLGLVR
jgi:hypothetical protein